MKPDVVAAYVDAAAAALDLPIAPAHRPGVLRYFALAASMAELVDAHALAHADEPAPVFVPVSPPGRPKGEHRSAQHEGSLMSPPGRPKGEHRSAQHEGFVVDPPGRPKGEHRSAQHEVSVVTPPAAA
jgi:16S rRNA (guanine527-N7)-methyltransferase